MTADAGVRANSNAVLIGVSAYECAEFPPIRAARNSLQAIQSLLADPALCGWPPELITVIANPISAADVASRVADLAEATTGVLLLYYVGHGVLSTQGELCLTVTSTRPNRPKITGLPWETFADVLRTCPARTRLAILDCCFAGQAIEALGADSQGLADITNVSGVYTLTATTRNRTAHVPPPDQQDTACTSFTSELQDLIRSGIPGKPTQLTFSDIYPELHQRLRAKGLPAPSQRGTDTAHQFPFTANTAARTGPTAYTIVSPSDGNDSRETNPKNLGTGQIARSRQARILTDALRAAWSITSEYTKARALVRIAEAVAAADPSRAARLAADAEGIAQSIGEEDWRALVLAEVAGVMAAADPDRAERIAQSIGHESYKASALARIAEAAAATDPDRAERIAQSIGHEDDKVSALARIAEAVAAAEPDRAARLAADAERIAQSIGHESRRAFALARIAEAVAAADPDRAERIAQSIGHEESRALVLVRIAEAVAAADPDRAEHLTVEAERIAQLMIIRSLSKATTLARIAGAVAAAEPDRAARLAADAERIAHAVGDNYSVKAFALTCFAEAVATADPDRAERVAQSIGHEESRAITLARIAEAVAAAEPDRADRLTVEAERVAQSIGDDSKAAVLVRIAEAVAATDPGTAA